MRTFNFIALFLALSAPAFASKIQQQGIVTAADCSSRSVANSACLPLDSQIYLSGLGEQLSVGLANGVVAPSASNLIVNAGLTASVSANALTINLLTALGSTPSAASPVIVNYRSTTNAIGQFFQLSTTGALSLVIPSGVTIGEISGVSEATYVYVQDNLGVNQLCVSANGTWDEGVPQITAALSDGATQNLRNILHCTAAANAPVRLIGQVVSTQTVAGTWATAPALIGVIPFAKPQTAYYSTGITGSVLSVFREVRRLVRAAHARFLDLPGLLRSRDRVRVLIP